MSQNPLALPLSGVYSGTEAATLINQALDTLATLNAGSSAPSGPEEGWFWLDISVANQATLKIYDGSNWLPIGTLDLTNHRWSPPVGGGVNTIAGAGTTDLGSVYQASVTISGTATITAFGSTAPVGALKFVTFSGASVLTYNATSLILPTAANITTAAGDCAIIQQVSSGNWRVIAYQLATGAALSSSANFLGAATFAGIISPTTLAADTNDYAPTSFSTSETLRESASTPGYKLTGVAGGSSGLQKTIMNVGSFNITITANDANSSAANRFLMPFPIVLTPGTSQQFRYDSTSSGWRPVGLHSSRTISGAFKNLKIINDNGAPTTTMDITADALTLEDSFGNAYRALSVSVAPVMTAGGVNGLDTGSIVNNTITFYAVYVIYNPATGTLAGLYSLSASAAALLASGNMPAGYTFAIRVGWVRTDGAATARWMRTTQFGRKTRYIVTATTNTANLPQIITGNQGSLTVPTWIAASISTFVPTTASIISVAATLSDTNGTGNSQIMVAPNNGYGGVNSLGNPPPLYINTGGAATSTVKQGGGAAADFLIESTNIYAAINAAGTGSVYCMGWEDNL